MTSDHWLKILFLEGDIVIKSNFFERTIIAIALEFVDICKAKTNF